MTPLFIFLLLYFIGGLINSFFVESELDNLNSQIEELKAENDKLRGKDNAKSG